MSDVPVGIVVGVDGSPSSRLAAQWAAQEAKARDLPVLLAAAYIVPQFLYAEGMVPSRAIFEELCRRYPRGQHRGGAHAAAS